jgi:3-deoxy-D-manno-octulosonic-acid transferase
MFHFEEISAMALERGAARQVLDVRDLVNAIALYFEQPELRRAAGRAAHTLVADNRGAHDRTLALVEGALRVVSGAVDEARRDARARSGLSAVVPRRD